MNEILIILITTLGAFFLGGFGVLLIGGKTTLTYLQVKMSKGKKILLMAKTPFGWRQFVAKRDQDTLRWYYDKKPMITSVKEKDVSRYMRIDFCFIDTKKPTVCLKLNDGQMYPSDFDPAVFNNILLRALTRPDTKSTDELKKLLMVAILAVLITLVVNIVTLSKVSKLLTGGVI